MQRTSQKPAGGPLRSGVIVVGFLFCMLVSLGCGASGSEDAPPPTPNSVGGTLAPGGSSETLEIGPDGVPVLVAEILADGVVTQVEYERAVLAHMQCLDEHGIEHGTPIWNTTGGYIPRWNYEVRVPPLDPDEEDPSETCFFTYEAPVQGEWVRQNQPSEEERQRREQQAVECVASLGYPEVKDYDGALRTMRSVSSTGEGYDYFNVRQCIDWAIQGTPRVFLDEDD